eukprot:CAMPEP_0175974374 /NCGR_PEP_ID=MMETSP0108-20121206/43342_1 /TAXON_ID=195067 ORGANISM="Goniomonas pacifica, Strain CCMP1869" /NCGR_SAMPLE_ID=MMETSP0108 /ASSEMBLY_ACC=CAM_ASM_000204 /LENGTH=110 /DNA_ID=CAMNT_0017303981 /DNA_START=936 /DNA_END=1268 /DNA_ORIENTATION=-
MAPPAHESCACLPTSFTISASRSAGCVILSSGALEEAIGALGEATCNGVAWLASETLGGATTFGLLIASPFFDPKGMRRVKHSEQTDSQQAFEFLEVVHDISNDICRINE